MYTTPPWLGAAQHHHPMPREQNALARHRTRSAKSIHNHLINNLHTIHHFLITWTRWCDDIFSGEGLHFTCRWRRQFSLILWISTALWTTWIVKNLSKLYSTCISFPFSQRSVTFLQILRFEKHFLLRGPLLRGKRRRKNPICIDTRGLLRVDTSSSLQDHSLSSPHHGRNQFSATAEYLAAADLALKNELQDLNKVLTWFYVLPNPCCTHLP